MPVFSMFVTMNRPRSRKEENMERLEARDLAIMKVKEEQTQIKIKNSALKHNYIEYPFIENI